MYAPRKVTKVSTTKPEGPAIEDAEPTAALPRAKGSAVKHKDTFIGRRLDHLFETVRPKGEKPYSHQQVADAICDAADDPKAISASYIWYLHSGQKENPTRRHIALLAAFFGVSPLYFFENAELGTDEIELARTLKDPRVYELARAASGLSDTSFDAATTLIRSLHQIEREARHATS